MPEQAPTTALAAEAAQADDRRLCDALRAGDERVFTMLVEGYHSSLLRMAMVYVRNRAVAEEVVQETWLGVLRGIERFEGRSSLRTWIFRILTNTAKTRAEREGRTLPFSSLTPEADSEPAVEPERFIDQNAARWAGHWLAAPSSWAGIPEERLLAGETLACVEAAISELPPTQREVITLRDVDGWTSAEVCSLLSLSEANQRVLLHRARSKVRKALEAYLGDAE